MTPEEAREIICSNTDALSPTSVRLSEALGRTLQEAITANDDVPPFDNSAMDGFAVCKADLQTAPVTLEVAGEIAAGSMPGGEVKPGCCMRIMTGAPLPANAAAVVPVEWTRMQGRSQVVINRLPRFSQYVRRAGRDMRQGEIVMNAGTLVTPPAVGLMATAGYASVSVSARPRVAIIVTGDELFRASGPLPRGKIRDSNGPALAAQVRYAQGVVSARLHAQDEKAHVSVVLNQAFEVSNVILLSGGVSVGNYDYVNEVLDSAGVTRHFWRVRQRPGGPLSFGTRGKKVLFGLPGNPVSSFVCFEQYVRPALQCMMGIPNAGPLLHKAELDITVSKAAGLHHFVRGVAHRTADGRLRVCTTGPQASNLYSSAAAANCLIHLPQDMENPTAGQAVDIEWLPWATDQLSSSAKSPA